jgi:hypothetical protein
MCGHGWMDWVKGKAFRPSAVVPLMAKDGVDKLTSSLAFDELVLSHKTVRTHPQPFGHPDGATIAGIDIRDDTMGVKTGERESQRRSASFGRVTVPAVLWVKNIPDLRRLVPFTSPVDHYVPDQSGLITQLDAQKYAIALLFDSRARPASVLQPARYPSFVHGRCRKEPVNFSKTVVREKCLDIRRVERPEDEACGVDG